MKLQLNVENANHGARTSPNIVLDANIWYSAIVYGGNPELVVDECLANWTIVASEQLKEELMDRLRHKAKAPYRWLRQFRIRFERIILLAVTKETRRVNVRDLKDLHVVNAALSENCEFIVTGDKDLLEINHFNGTQIITSNEFLNLIA